MAGQFQGHASTIWSVAYSSDGRHIVSGSWDNTVRVWDVTTGQTVAGPFQGHTSAIWSIAYSPDGESIVSGPNDHSIKV